jgi:hypothetical protein
VVGALLLTIVTVAGPLFVTTYPPITDLPFHAAECAILRHLHDPSWGFDRQMTSNLGAVPCGTFAVLGAALSVALPIATATKVAAAIMLAQLPIGLSVLAASLKKSPLLGVLATPLAWTTLSHWGFFPYVGATGLTAAAVGLALMVVDRPTIARRVWLAVVLLLTVETHVTRSPLALFGVASASFAAASLPDGLRVLAPAMLPALARFGAFLAVGAGRGILPTPSLPDVARLGAVPGVFAGGFQGTLGVAERWAVAGAVALTIAIAVSALARSAPRVPSDRAWRVGRGLVAVMAAASLTLFLTLPMSIGEWWMVFPRELLGAALFSLALLPDLPVRTRPALALAACVPGMLVACVTAVGYREFDQASLDFRRILAAVQPAPRLAYVVFDHGGSSRAQSPFVHLPAWVQAERGGWLSFHFASFGWSAIRYRDGGDVPPKSGERAEWSPTRFSAASASEFFDTFLVRSRVAPDALFASNPRIRLVQRSGTWWLYRRDPE